VNGFRSNGFCKFIIVRDVNKRLSRRPTLQITYLLLFAVDFSSSEWTTEKEINAFVDWGVSGTISQTIDGPLLLNMIPFRKGGSFGVKGRLTIPDPEGIRTDFEFESATLDLGKWGSYTLPPVGKGHFDTIYLDDFLRIDVNSRDDILICTSGNA
jgi:hypothetical protein